MVALPITNVNELQAISGYGAGAEYYLANDIDATITSTWNAGAGFIPIIAAFVIPPVGTLSFDGRGHKITNLYINRPGTYDQGLFGSFTAGINIMNTVLENCHVEGKSWVGGLVNTLLAGSTISNCRVTGDIVANGNYAGGICGINYGTITKCMSGANVWNEDWGIDYGSFVGHNDGTVTDCYAVGTVEARYATYLQTGGFAGRNFTSGVINRCFSTGLVLPVQGSSVTVCGFVGANDNTITASYWDTESSGYTIGTDPASDPPSGKTTAQMKQQATYAGWDFINTWKIIEGISYPMLRIGKAKRRPHK